MKTHMLFLMMATVMATAGSVMSQAVIARQNGSGEPATHFHYLPPGNPTSAHIQNVIDEAEPGDTLYLPGETFTMTDDIVVNKKLIIVGTGIHPDSATVPGATMTTITGAGTLHFVSSGSGASGSELHGIRFSESGGNSVTIRIGRVSNDNESFVSELKISQCEIAGEIYLGYHHLGGRASNILITQCVIKGMVRVQSASNVRIISNIFNDATFKWPLYYGTSSTLVANNIIFDYTINSTLGNSGVTYRNNIFTKPQSTPFVVTEQSTYEDNLWLFNSGGSVNLSGVLNGGTANSTNISFNGNINDVFTYLDLPAANRLTQFSYHSNYRLKPASPYNDMNGSGPAGLYGEGDNTWKDGTLPFNPHWQAFINGNLSTENGLISIRIKAAAQQH